MENNDSVCYVSKINEIKDIEGADRIQLATINGWNSVIPKNQLSVGDLVLCLTTDAVIPQEFGEKHGILNYLRKGNRIRTVKLRGVYSDCILIPVRDLDCHFDSMDCPWMEGDDLMDKLKIFKYQEPEKIVTIPGGKKVKQKDNLNFNKYYKFPNYKNVPHIFNEEDDIVITRKIHGSNARYGIVKKSSLSLWDKIKKFFKLSNRWDEYEYTYGSHNVIKGSDTNGFYSTDVWRELGDKYNIKNKLWQLLKNGGEVGSGIILYGEIYGESIQGEKYNYGLKGRELILFDIQVDGEYVDREQFEFLSKNLDIPYTQRLYTGKFSKEIVDGFVLNQFIEGTKIPHEGVVVGHVSGDRAKVAKFINPEYLIFGEKYVVPENH